MFEGDRLDVVHRAGLAMLVEQEFGYEKHRDASGASGRIRSPREHRVNYVLCQVLVAPGNEDLGAEKPVCPVTLLDRLGSEGADIRTCLRLGQVHCPAPLATDQLLHVELFEVGARVSLERLHQPVGEHRAQRECHVGGLADLLEGHPH